MLADWDGDGRTDLLWVDFDTRTWHVVPSTGGGAGPWINTGIAAPDGTAGSSTTPMATGSSTSACAGRTTALSFSCTRARHRPPDLATSFVDGFGLLQGQPTYVSIARSHHERQSTAQYPDADFQAPLYVVSEFVASDGAAGTYRNGFTYAGARRNLQGRGFLGFETQRISDTRSGLVTVDSAGRSFPFTGLHTGRNVFQADGSTRVSSWTADLAQAGVGPLGAEERRISLHCIEHGTAPMSSAARRTGSS